MKSIFLSICFLFFSFVGLSQALPSGYPVFWESSRIDQLLADECDSIKYSFLKQDGLRFPIGFSKGSFSNMEIGVVPLIVSVIANSSRPYWYSPNGMIPGKGFQIYTSGGVFISHKFFSLEFQPEINLAQNASYSGSTHFRYITSFGDAPETFGDSGYSRVGFGQSKFSGKFKAFEFGFSTANLWWGPGQWNALTFSNNAPGFLHGVFGTHRPAKTFFGLLEFQLISGFPKSKKYIPYQESTLNIGNYLKPNRDRYLNALNISVSPKWIKGFSIGAARTVQTFSDSVDVRRFIDVLPVFWGVTKESVGSDLVGQSDRGRDQQISVFFRYVVPKAGFEFYGEFGRRDHALNMRDLVLSPAHSRAYILGFSKVFQMPDSKLIQIRGEMTQQGQSVNWLVRANSTTPWHTNGTIGGFTNWDQAMGVGIGMGSNVQMLEVSRIEGINRVGVYLERLPQHMDFYELSNLAKLGYRPWVDFTAGPIFDHQWKNLIFSGRMLFTYASNYYWSQGQGSQLNADFPVKNENLFSTSTQINLIYLFGNRDGK